MAFFFRTKNGRLAALLANIFGTILSVYLLMQFYSALYALLLMLFALSVSATQCKSRLKITTPVLVLNIAMAGLGLASTFYFTFQWVTSNNLPADYYIMPVSLLLFSLVGLINTLIIYKLHFRKVTAEDQDNS